MKITFVGLGIMGSRLATNLTEKRAELTIWNRNQEATKAFENRSGSIATSAH